MGSQQLPVVLSMEVCGEEPSEYRMLINGEVRYITIVYGTFDSFYTLAFPIHSLPDFPRDQKWNIAKISRDPMTKELKPSLSYRKLAGIGSTWHPNLIDCLSYTGVELHSAAVSGVTFLPSKDTNFSATPERAMAIAKIARFERELPRIERETRVYRALEGSGLAPRFHGHIHEHGRVIGFLLEKVEGQRASVEDLEICRNALRGLHELGFLHGDANRYNFIVRDGTVKLIDFENSREHQGDRSAMQTEMNSLEDQLKETTGRGAGFLDID